MLTGNKKYYILFTALLLIATVVFVDSSKIEKISKIEPISAPLSVAQYKTFHDELIALVNQQDPRVALKYLDKSSQTNPALLRSCHSLVHEIGRATYVRYGDFAKAMSYRNEECNSGFLHGVIEEALAKSPDPLEDVKYICNSYGGETYLSWECYHGIGHGLMLVTENNLPRSITYCKEFQTHFMQDNCANGVYMENFNTDQKVHVSHYLDPRDPFVPCETQPSEFQRLCYVYAPAYFLSLYPNQYDKALTWCLAAKNGNKDACISGVGSQMMKEQLYNSSIVEGECDKTQFGLRGVCIAGAATLLAYNYGRTDEAKAFCETLSFFNRRPCLAALKAMDGNFAIPQ